MCLGSGHCESCKCVQKKFRESSELLAVVLVYSEWSWVVLSDPGRNRLLRDNCFALCSNDEKLVIWGWKTRRVTTCNISLSWNSGFRWNSRLEYIPKSCFVRHETSDYCDIPDFGEIPNLKMSINEVLYDMKHQNITKIWVLEKFQIRIYP